MNKWVDGNYINVSIYSLLSGSSYVELPDKLRNSKKALIIIKNDDNKCFLWCHIRYLNPLKTHSERITKADKKMVNGLGYGDIKFLFPKKVFSKIEKKNSISINVFDYGKGLVYLIHVSNEKFEHFMDLLSIAINNKSHYLYQIFYQIYIQ